MKKISILLALSLASTLFAQDLRTSVEEVLSTNPVVLERLKNYNVTKEDITIAKAGYYPKIDLSIGVGIENNQKRTDWQDNTILREDGQLTDSSTLDVYQASLVYTQNIFEGFKTHYKIEQQLSRTTAAAYNYIENANDTSFKMVETYLQVMRNNELLETAQENIKINKEILKKVKKLYDAGLTTLSEVNKIEASLSLARSNYVVQDNTLLDVKYNMHRILGRYLDTAEMSKPVLNVALPASIEDATQIAMLNNPSLIVATYNVKAAQTAYKGSKSPFYPKVDIELSQTMNSNLSGTQGDNNRFRVMAFLSYNLFNGYIDTTQKQQNISLIHKEVEVKNDLRRQTIEGLTLSWAANEKLDDQLVYLEKYKEFASKTLTLYAKEYDLGRRSLLDLLSAQNDFIEAKQQIINTEYSALFAKYRVLDAMGTLVTTVLGDVDVIYNNVGLMGETPKNPDTLPISYDKDVDLIVDNFDICNNSHPDKMRNIYGCAFVYEDTKKIDRYNNFLFDNDSTTLTLDAQSRFDDLITQLDLYEFRFLKFDILSNIDNDELKKEKKQEISEQRAQYIKDELLEAGALEENIVIHANSDRAPINSRETHEGIQNNNRVDIIVRKLIK